MVYYLFLYVFLVLCIVLWPLIFYGCASYCEVRPCILFCAQFLSPLSISKTVL